MNIYQLTVPVFEHYLKRLDHLLALAQKDMEKHGLDEQTLLQLSLQQGMLPFGQQINVSVSFVLRSCFPLAGKEIPELFYGSESLHTIRENLQQALVTVSGFKETDFETANIQTMDIQPGQAKTATTLSATEFVQLYILPNFFFHCSMAYALMRGQGFDIGKGDFDGFTEFAPGFSFVE